MDSPYGRGGIVLEARKSGTTKSDLLFLAAMVEEKLSEAGIVLEDTPRYNEPFQIDEAVLEQVLENEVKYYFNPRAKDYDINSVRSIYVIREDEAASSLEEARAVFRDEQHKICKSGLGIWSELRVITGCVKCDY